MKRSLVWIFGRGASVECGLNWVVPDEWKSSKEREDQITLIKSELRAQMESSAISTKVYEDFLSLLSHTSSQWHNYLVTTNWDCLLQKAINNLNLSFKPDYLANTHVFHLNGTIEELKNNTFRSPFLLETDPPQTRTKTIEANKAFNHMIWQQDFVLVGMSFQCEMDKALLDAFHHVEDDLPIGESNWIIINPNDKALESVVGDIQESLPAAEICPIQKQFGHWLEEGAPELKEKGIIVV